MMSQNPQPRAHHQITAVPASVLARIKNDEQQFLLVPTHRLDLEEGFVGLVPEGQESVSQPAYVWCTDVTYTTSRGASVKLGQQVGNMMAQLQNYAKQIDDPKAPITVLRFLPYSRGAKIFTT